MMDGRTVRIATVRKTGATYLVQQLSGRNLDQVNCWREFTSVTFTPKGAVKKMSVDGSITFHRGEVDLKEVLLNVDIAKQLCQTACGDNPDYTVRHSRHKVKPQ